jgi:hypothetical protein
MFATQVYGTILGGFVNYVVMISIVNSNRDLLVNSNGDSSWSGATMQSYNTNATSWALAKYLYKTGEKYAMVPIGIAIGAALVAVHRIVVVVSVPCKAWRNTSSLVPLTLALSSSPRSKASTYQRSTCPSLFSSPVIFHTTNPRLASSSAKFLPGSSANSTFGTGNLASSRTTCTWSPGLGTEPVSQSFSSCLLRSSVPVVLRSLCPTGGAIILMGTTIFALLVTIRRDFWLLFTLF